MQARAGVQTKEASSYLGYKHVRAPHTSCHRRRGAPPSARDEPRRQRHRSAAVPKWPLLCVCLRVQTEYTICAVTNGKSERRTPPESKRDRAGRTLQLAKDSIKSTYASFSTQSDKQQLPMRAASATLARTAQLSARGSLFPLGAGSPPTKPVALASTSALRYEEPTDSHGPGRRPMTVGSLLACLRWLSVGVQSRRHFPLIMQPRAPAHPGAPVNSNGSFVSLNND